MSPKITPPTDKRFDAAVQICKTLVHAGHRALLAGGCVRDLILRVPPKDYDVATSAKPEQVARLFPKCVDVGAQFGVQIILTPEVPVEVTTFRVDGPYRDGRHPEYVTYSNEVEDARRRDFTINAMFYNPETRDVIDYAGGLQDLDRRIIRAVGDPAQRFSEDRLRLLRAVRFAARLGYTIEPRTLDAVRESAGLVLTTSPERIRDELLKMLVEGGARRAFELMDQTGLLSCALPEIHAMKGVEQPPEFHPEGDVYEHTLRALDYLDGASPTLAMGVLLHDVGKPAAQTFEDRIRFNYHDKVGARMAGNICRRLRMSHHDTSRIAWMVENHMRVSITPDMRESKLKRLVRHPWFPELLELCRIDCLASHGDLRVIEWLRNYIAHMPQEELKPPPLISGRDLIDMGYKPGPLFSDLITAVEDAQLEGKIHSPEDARRFIRELRPPLPPGKQ